MNHAQRLSYLHDATKRLCDECGGITSAREAGYSTLIRATGYSTLIRATGWTEHFCSKACACAHLNTPGLPDDYRKLKIYAIAVTVLNLVAAFAVMVRTLL